MYQRNYTGYIEYLNAGKGERVPRLTDLLRYVSTTRTRDGARPFVLLDIKSSNPLIIVEKMVQVVLNLAAEIGAPSLPSHLIFATWTHAFLNSSHAHRHTGIQLSWAAEDVSGPAAERDLLSRNVDNLNLPWAFLQNTTMPFIQRAQDAEKTVYAWTIDQRGEMEQSVKAGVDGIITNNPRLLRQVLSERPSDMPWLRIYALAILLLIWLLLRRSDTSRRNMHATGVDAGCSV